MFSMHFHTFLSNPSTRHFFVLVIIVLLLLLQRNHAPSFILFCDVSIPARILCVTSIRTQPCTLVCVFAQNADISCDDLQVVGTGYMYSGVFVDDNATVTMSGEAPRIEGNVTKGRSDRYGFTHSRANLDQQH